MADPRLCKKLEMGIEPNPNPDTPNWNPILMPFRTEPNKPKEFDGGTRTEPNYQIERTEPNPNSP